MKKIIFQKLLIKNFLSVGEESVEISFRSGFNIITGINQDENDIKNGVGKTLIIDALYFAIFGTTLRDLSNQSYIINRQIGKNCEVWLEFDNYSSKHDYEHFIIKRTLAPKSLTVFCNNEDKTQSSIIETNKYIRAVLSANEDIFKNCIIMRANNTVPFMMKGNAAKKSFIESIFNLSIFSDMLKEVKDDLRAAKSSYDISNTEYTVIYNNKQKYEQEIKHLTIEAEQKLKNTQVIIQQFENEIKEYQNQIILLENKKNTFQDYSEKIQEQQQIKNKADLYYQQTLKSKYQVEASINTYNHQLSLLLQDNNICPTCKREYDETHKQHVNEAKFELEKNIQSANEKLINYTTKEKQFKEIITNLNDIIQELLAKQNEIRYNATRIRELNQLIVSKHEQIKFYQTAENNTGIESFKELLNKALIDLQEKEKLVKQHKKEITKLNICEHILGEYGIRAYVVNKLLVLLNSYIAYYLNQLKSTFRFNFNELFEDEIKDSHGLVCSYGNCSGAEMKKIDLAISFAFLDIIKQQHQLEYNILFLDEILDSSLDTKSLEYVIKFLDEYVKNNHIGLYLITHKSDVNLPDITDVITLIKENGFTTFPGK